MQDGGDGGVEVRLAEGADEAEDDPRGVEFCRFIVRATAPEEFGGEGEQSVDTCVRPRADGVAGRVLPGLEGVGVGEVVGGFPVVEDFVAVLDGVVESCERVAGEEEGEDDAGGKAGRGSGLGSGRL